MKKLQMILLAGSVLLLAATPVFAQNSVSGLGGGPQPPDNPEPAAWSTTSNANPTPMDITAPITADYYFMPNGGGTPLTPTSATGLICLANANNLITTTTFGQIAADCQAGGGVALLLFPEGTVTAPANIPVFSMDITDGDFLENNVGFNATTNISNFPIRINLATPATNLTNEHNCAASQAGPSFDGPGTPNYNPNQNLCEPAGSAAGEPDVLVDSQGTIYVESIRGVPGGLDLWRWYAPTDGPPNPDGTLPFKYEGQPDGCGINATISDACTTAGVAPGGGDGDIAVNAPDPTNSNIPNLAIVSLTAAEVTSSHSTTRGDTYSMINPAVAQIPANDRQWIDGVNDATHVYLDYHDFETTSQILVQRSNDGGETYNNGTGMAVTPTFEPDVLMGDGEGQIKVDNTQCPTKGNVYQIWVGADSTTDNANGLTNNAYVSVSTDVNLTTPVLNFQTYTIFSCGAGSNCPSDLGLFNLFPTLAVDKFGYVYAVWSDNTTIYYSYSKNAGQTWAPAIHVNSGSTVGMSNVFPWVSADANGHVAVTWYGANAAGNSNSTPPGTQWNVYAAETVNGHAHTPIFTQSMVSDHVIHLGTISTGGLTGTADRTLLDFFQVSIDPTNHLVNIAFADDHATPGTAVTYFTREKKAMSGIVTNGTCAVQPND